mgnify:CR=1 FL=1
MYRGRYEGKHRKTAAPARGRSLRTGRLTTMVIATVLLLALAIGGTLAWLSTEYSPIQNKFLPTKVTCEVTEKFNGTTGEKTKVNVKNTGTIDAFIRVKLVTYRTNDQGQHIGGTASLPAFTLGTGWVKYGDYYYYTKPVAPNQNPETNLTDSMMLIGSYLDTDGGKQAVDVMAEAIQSVPEDAVKAAWGSGFSIGSDGSLIVPGN